MVTRNRKTLEPGVRRRKKKAEENPAGTGKDESCRCKETSQMKPGQLLKLMASDLAFWKKVKK